MYFIYFCSKSMLMPEFVQLDVKVFDKFIESFQNDILINVLKQQT